MRGTRRNPWRLLTEARVTYALKILMVFVLAFYAGQFVLEILIRLQAVVYILVGAVFLAYVIYPAVQRLRRRMPLVLAIVLVYLGIILALVIAAFFVVPHIVDDIGLLVHRYPDLVARLHSLIYNPNDPLTSRLPAWLQNEIANAPVAIATWVQTKGLQAFGQLTTVLAGTRRDRRNFHRRSGGHRVPFARSRSHETSLSAIVPEERWRATMGLLSDIDGVIGGFIRGQLLVALMIGILITIAMMHHSRAVSLFVRSACRLGRSHSVRRCGGGILSRLHLGGPDERLGQTACSLRSRSCSSTKPRGTLSRRTSSDGK